VRITDLKCTDERGRTVPCDASDNNVAFSCLRCAHPMLAMMRPSQRGSSPDHPARCRKCGFECWVEPHTESLRVYSRSIG
jgi:hypothetical protein